MSKLAVNLRLAIVALGMAACAASCTSDTNSAAPPPPPPPLPTAPVVPAAPAVDPAPPDEEAESAKTGAASKHDPEEREDLAKEHAKAAEKPADGAKEHTGGESLYDLAKEGKATLPDSKPSTSNGKVSSSDISKPVPRPPEQALPVPKPPVPAKPEQALPVGKVSIPSTANVRIEVPRGMQDLLNKDTRMGPWVKQVVDVADKCYAQERKTNALAEGSIPVTVTMHENDRPDADLKSLPPQLSGVVACATGKLMRIKMPLFTGPEGQKHSVKIVFSK